MSNMDYGEIEKMQKRFSDMEIRFMKEQGLISADVELERFGIVESRWDSTGMEYEWINHFKALEEKVEIIEELIKMKADDFKWETTTTTTRKLVKKY